MRVAALVREARHPAHAAGGVRRHAPLQPPARGPVDREPAVARLLQELVHGPVGQQLLEPLGEEDAVGVGLDHPVVHPVVAQVHELGPHAVEDVGVQRRVPLAAVGHGERETEELDLDRGGGPLVQQRRAVAEDRPLVAGEDAHVLLLLLLQQPRLVAEGQHQRVAVERGALLVLEAALRALRLLVLLVLATPAGPRALELLVELLGHVLLLLLLPRPLRAEPVQLLLRVLLLPRHSIRELCGT
mmetsp:Transcript_29075/g.83537  ORF Transcript_29075/g.83537 Transcript_29075/m.83537 type:complete len:244 (+) Transcript_29075:1174-1905(+)